MVTTRSASKATTPVGGRQPARGWAHAPSQATLLWLAVSLPLVVWDSIYVLCRPLTMPGGSMHWPFWAPYELYGRVDYVYGWPAFEARNGFTSAQGSLNVIETAMYLAYLYIYYAEGRPVGGVAGAKRVLAGRPAGFAVLLAFSAAVMTLSKTVLYCELFFCVCFCRGPCEGFGCRCLRHALRHASLGIIEFAANIPRLRRG